MNNLRTAAQAIIDSWDNNNSSALVLTNSIKDLRHALADHIPDTGKIVQPSINRKWRAIAERIEAGESEESVLFDYGLEYVRASPPTLQR